MDLIANSKRRKLKREHTLSSEAGGEYSQVVPPPPPGSLVMSQSFDPRERAEKKAALLQPRVSYTEEAPRMHGKEAVGKISRRDSDQYPYAIEMLSSRILLFGTLFRP